MAEPNHNQSAEEQLKRYAEERRKQPVAELHSATRAMLQGEVVRTYGKKREKPSLFSRWLLNPQLLWVIPLLAVILVLGVQNFRGAKKQEEIQSAEKAKEPVAMVSPAPAPVSVPEAPVATAPAGQAVDMLRQKVQVTTREAKKETAKDMVAVAPPTTPAPGAAGGLGAEVKGRRDEASAARVIAKAELDENLNFSNSAQPQEERLRLYANVMNNFQLQRTGGKVEFVDEDKSVYAGHVVGRRGTTNLFRAEGTNQTLRMPVVITGQYFNVRTPGQAPAQQQVRAQAQSQLNANNEQTFLQGQAVVGRSNQIPIEAQSGAPSR